ncbi:endonuclease/exonuclease/phosphatase family protein [Paenibacillus glycanilyticus]|uniref:Endonuclease n=1 Tax=Paenibacillus glycanilyticus TaxID=126569 RepID=A0ABQ6GG14_9BACL|nr:endonuclease/exonuclease/phosphatase family protein [Paenibacillus glycanilyticus]GLX69778.1 endonuclease [Paenibacillus glycanilyticus]
MLEVKVMTFNLRYPEINDGPNYWPERIERATAVINKHQPMLIGTQEGYHSMLKDLEPRLNEYDWVGQGRFGEHENEHNAIFFNRDELAMEESGQFWLSETPDVEASVSWESSFPRICTWTRFRHRESGQSFYLYNTHLDHHSQEAKDRGIQVVEERIARQRAVDGLPALLTGDFNSYPDERPIQFLRGEIGINGKESGLNLTDAYLPINGAPGSTFHEFKGGDTGEPIDYIFATDEFEVLSVEVDRCRIDGGYPSDHYPVVATTRLG